MFIILTQVTLNKLYLFVERLEHGIRRKNVVVVY